MLLTFECSNFLKFRERFNIKMQFFENHTPYKIFKVLGIDGEDLSGKSTVFKSLLFFSEFFKHNQICDNIELYRQEKPIVFRVNFVNGMTDFSYMIEISTKDRFQILSERLSYTAHNRQRIDIFNSVCDIVSTEEYNQRMLEIEKRKYTNDIENILYKFPQNVARISFNEEAARSFGIYDLIKSLQVPDTKSVFIELLHNSNNLMVNNFSYINNFFNNFYSIRHVPFREDNIFHVVNRKIDYKGYIKYVRLIMPNAEKIIKDLLNNTNEYDMSPNELNMLGMILPISQTLIYGGVCLIDDFTLNTDPEMIKKVISLFENNKNNDNSAQLIVTGKGISEYIKYTYNSSNICNCEILKNNNLYMEQINQQ